MSNGHIHALAQGGLHQSDTIRLLQSAAVEEILQGGDVLLASHTGSGKTLAYLLPVVRSLLPHMCSCFRGSPIVLQRCYDRYNNAAEL